MRTAIVLALTSADIAALPVAKAELQAAGVERLWIIHSPALGITTDAVSKQFDDRITAIKNSERQAADRGDYDAAKDFREEAEAIALDKSLAVKKGWESVPEADRNAAYDKALAPMLDTQAFPNISVTVLREDIQPDGIFGILQGLLAQWPAAVAHGEYSIVWPKNCTGIRTAEPQEVTQKKEVKAPDPKPEIVKVKAPTKPQPELPPKEARRKQLFSQYMTMKAVAKQHGIPMEGVAKELVIDSILRIEFPEAA
jgi:hypothetical protein